MHTPSQPQYDHLELPSTALKNHNLNRMGLTNNFVAPMHRCYSGQMNI
jgi:hypothetical protein